MALKNFFFRENWVGNVVAGMKIAFLPFLTQPGPTFWSQKDPNTEFLKQNFNFQSLRKAKATYIIVDLRCLHFWSKKYACALHGRPKLQSSHYQNKHLTRMLFVKHSLLLWSIMPYFCCIFGSSKKTKTGSKSSISPDPESLSQKKVDSYNQKRKLDTQSNWQLRNMQKVFHQW